MMMGKILQRFGRELLSLKLQIRELTQEDFLEAVLIPTCPHLTRIELCSFRWQGASPCRDWQVFGQTYSSQLKSLLLQNYGIEDSQFSDIFQRCYPVLQDVSILKCNSLTSASFGILLSRCPMLKSLHWTCYKMKMDGIVSELVKSDRLHRPFQLLKISSHLQVTEFYKLMKEHLSAPSIQWPICYGLGL